MMCEVDYNKSQLLISIGSLVHAKNIRALCLPFKSHKIFEAQLRKLKPKNVKCIAMAADVTIYIGRTIV